MSQDWTNQHQQRRYTIDDSRVRFETQSFREAVYIKKENVTKNKKSNFPSHKEEEKHICL